MGIGGALLSGKVAGTFGVPSTGLNVTGTLGQPNGVGVVSLDWRFTEGSSFQFGSQVGTIVKVTPKSATSASNTIDVYFPSLNGQAPVQPPGGTPIRFPDPITPPLGQRPYQELGVKSLANNAGEMVNLQYGHPGPQPRFNVGENQLLVPFYTIID